MILVELTEVNGLVAEPLVASSSHAWPIASILPFLFFLPFSISRPTISEKFIRDLPNFCGLPALRPSTINNSLLRFLQSHGFRKRTYLLRGPYLKA